MANVSGVGHDDETNPDHPAHTSISKGGECRTQATDKKSKALMMAGILGTAYFHPCVEGECPPGFRRIHCRCGKDDVCVCYTFDHDLFWQWYEEQKWTWQLGSYTYPYTHVQEIPEDATRTLPCPAGIVLSWFGFASSKNCAGFGPEDANNALIQEGRAELRKAVDRVSCESGCQKRVTETFTGWKCDPLSVPAVEAVVQWRVDCVP
jgi:hypothetical protein